MYADLGPGVWKTKDDSRDKTDNKAREEEDRHNKQKMTISWILRPMDQSGTITMSLFRPLWIDWLNFNIFTRTLKNNMENDESVAFFFFSFRC